MLTTTYFFFRNKTFLFFKIESWNFQHLFVKKFQKLHKISTQSDNWKMKINNCLNKLNELKFGEVARNSISNRFWKFQLSILKNKKVLFQKKIKLQLCEWAKWVEILRGFTKFNFKVHLKCSAFYLEKQKSFIPKKDF